MTIKHLICIAFFSALSAITFSQNKNPFQVIGKKGRILTLSNGAFDELFDQNDIQQIGMALVNIRTMKVVALLKNKGEAKRILDNSSSSRFLSVDPITKSYPMLSPYQYASNRPIDGTDLDGKEWASETTIGKTGSAIVVQTTFTVRIKVENNSTRITDPNLIRAKAEVYKQAVESKFKGEATIMLYGAPFKVIFKTDVVLDYTPRMPNDENFGHLIFDDRTSRSNTTVRTEGNTTTTTTFTHSVPGDTQGEINEFTTRIGITMDGRPVSDADMGLTDQHEAGHSGGLNHPWRLSDIERPLLAGLNQQNQHTADVNTIKSNLMNSDENPDVTYRSSEGSDLLLGQLFSMARRIAQRSNFTPQELKPATPANNTAPANNTPNTNRN